MTILSKMQKVLHHPYVYTFMWLKMAAFSKTAPGLPGRSLALSSEVQSCCIVD